MNAANVRRGGNVESVCAAFSISERAVRQAILAGELRSHAVLGKCVILYSDAEDWIRTKPRPVVRRKRVENPSCLPIL